MYSVTLAYLLWFLSGFGALGLHRFYLGKYRSGILWLCTGGLFIVGSIYDFFTLGGQVRDANLKVELAELRARKPSVQWRNVTNEGRREPKDSIERSILKVAKEKKGVITPAEVALSSNISIDEAKKELDTMLSKGYVEMRVRKSGTIVYTIPEMMDGDSELEDF
ncbi:MAG: TM2 domain-containing protein [Treponema sp.]|jgi:predicted transcriptional regulator|nr:TM2 domain-containing protein [Treponema sp.]